MGEMRGRGLPGVKLNGRNSNKTWSGTKALPRKASDFVSHEVSIQCLLLYPGDYSHINECGGLSLPCVSWSVGKGSKVCCWESKDVALKYLPHPTIISQTPFC